MHCWALYLCYCIFNNKEKHVVLCCIYNFLSYILHLNFPCSYIHWMVLQNVVVVLCTRVQLPIIAIHPVEMKIFQLCMTLSFLVALKSSATDCTTTQCACICIYSWRCNNWLWCMACEWEALSEFSTISTTSLKLRMLQLTTYTFILYCIVFFSLISFHSLLWNWNFLFLFYSKQWKVFQLYFSWFFLLNTKIDRFQKLFKSSDMLRVTKSKQKLKLFWKDLGFKHNKGLHHDDLQLHQKL